MPSTVTVPMAPAPTPAPVPVSEKKIAAVTKVKGGYRQINKSLNICAFEDYLDKQQSTLPYIADVEQISPRVIRVLGQNAGQFTLQGTNTYIVGTGAQRLIIDTAQGVKAWADLISSTLSTHSISLSHVFLTHWHGDHTGGVPDLLRLYPDLSSGIYKNAPGRDQKPIADGQVFRVEGATLRAVHTPGHSHDHMSFVLEEENAMFTGDNVLGHGTSAVEELGTYMDTLRKMQAQGCAVGYPAHGVVVTDLGDKIAGELRQKTRREKQVLQALGEARRWGPAAASGNSGGGGGRIAGSVTVKQLVALVYGEKMGDELREKALEPFVDEVLRKLAEDGKVAFQMSGGEKRWFGLEFA